MEDYALPLPGLELEAPRAACSRPDPAAPAAGALEAAGGMLQRLSALQRYALEAALDSGADPLEAAGAALVLEAMAGQPAAAAGRRRRLAAEIAALQAAGRLEAAG